MSEYKKFVEAVQNGAATSEEIAEATGLAQGHVQRVLKEAVEDGALARYRDGKAWVYQTQDAHGTATSRAPTDDGLMPVNRDYTAEFARRVPDSAHEYVPTNGELDELRLFIKHSDKLTPGLRARIGGDSGTGKTTLAKRLAYEHDMPVFTIQGRYMLNESDLLGTPKVADDITSVWVDGVLTKALLASREGKVMLLIDEANRARVQALTPLFPALDDRCEVTLDGPRGGEVIQGDPHNLVVIATVNEGPQYVNERTDDALNRRLGKKYTIKYLGQNDRDAEATLVAERTGIDARIAKEMVTVANNLRSMVNDRDSAIYRGVPTSALLSWAESAQILDAGGMANPIVRAARGDVVEALYDEDEAAEEAAMSVIEPKFRNAPVDPDEYEAFTSNDYVSCRSCGWETPRSRAERKGYTATMDCPDCGADASLRYESY